MEGRKIAIVHYTYLPIIGGVEIVIQAHAKILAKKGHKIKIITGAGKTENGIEVKIIPELRSLALVDEDLNKKLKEGKLSEKFNKLKDSIFLKIKKELEDMDVCIIHNVMTMHFNLPFTCALKDLIERFSSTVKFYLWCHDSALLNPAYKKDIPLVDRYPWCVLSEFNPKVDYIAISELRQKQLAEIFSINPELIQVVPVGIDLKSFLDISDPVWDFAWNKGLFEADVAMFFPSRILKRKNYELGIKVAKEIKKKGKKCKFVITAPPDPHNPETAWYFDYLHKLCRELEVEEEVLFLSEWKNTYGLKLNYEEIKDLYSICDVLFITSTQEGFGIPLLEAGAKRMPIICTNIQSLAEVVKDYALRIDLKEDISEVATKILKYLTRLPNFSMFKRVARHYSWEAIYKNYLKKLVTKDAKNRHR